jgi:hypothetical protein
LQCFFNLPHNADLWQSPNHQICVIIHTMHSLGHDGFINDMKLDCHLCTNTLEFTLTPLTLSVITLRSMLISIKPT